MKRRHGADLARASLEAKPAPARLGDSLVSRQQSLGRGIAEADQDIGIDQLDLAPYEGQADRSLLRRWRAIAGRPPRHDVGDIGAFAIEPDRGQHAVEELAGAADERQALDVLVAAGCLA